MQKKIFLILFLIFVFGYLLRVIYLSQNFLTFGYDQARDAVNAIEISQGNLKIFGPPASQPGLFHGVLWYYVLAPFYLIGKGSPIIAAYGIAFINMLTIFVVFLLTKFITKKTTIGLIASLLFAFSFEATQYATWLSNPTLGVLTVPIMYLGLWRWTNSPLKSFSNKLWPVITALGLGLSIQAEVFLAYHIVPLLIWIYVSRKNIARRHVFIFLGVLLITLTTMFLAQLKFGIAPTLKAISEISQGSQGNLAYQKSLGDYLILYLNQIGRIFSFNSYPGNVVWGSIFVIAVAIIGTLKRDRRMMFLATWLFSHITVVSAGGTSTPFLMVGIGPAVSIVIAIFLGDLLSKKYNLLVYGILFVLIFGNINFIFSQNKNGSTLFSIQKDMLLSKQLKAIDYSYEKAGGKEFSVNTLTSPLWVNIVWSYLYKWYGQNTYGYIPTWRGRGQEGQVIALQNKNEWEKGFLIIEPLDGIPPQYLPDLLDQENSYSEIISEKNFGAINVQERISR